MVSSISFLLAGLATMAALVDNADAFWRMECRGRTGLARLDPLISPGTISDHAHTVHGGSGFGKTTEYADLAASKCTSCSVSQDKSAYWTPVLYFQDSAGKFHLVDQVGGMLAYYFLYPLPGNTTVTAFPSGFKMIAGNTNQRNYTLPVPDIEKSLWASNPAQVSQEGLAAKAVGFNCLNYPLNQPEGALVRHFLPDKAFLDANCPSGLRFELMFPSCWDGVNKVSANHKSHVAYPDLVMNGNCPPTHPVRTPGLFYETIWDTNAFKGQSGQFVIANGDPTGYGYHGDFISGWDEGHLQAAANSCTNLSGKIEDCPLFNIQEASIYDTCEFNMPAELQNEDVTGPMAAIPGNVAIQSGPGLATMGATNVGAAPTTVGPAVTVPTISPTAGSTVATSGTVVPGAVFAESVAEASTADAIVVAAAAPTTTPVVAAAVQEPTITSAPVATLKDNQKIYSTSYSTIGREVVEIVMVEELVTVEAEVTVTTTIIAPQVARRHEHMHRRANLGHV